MKIKKSVQETMTRFQIPTLRKEQIAPINSILKGNDTFFVGKTSTGKSLVYQLTAVMHEDQLTIVVEPTISLMHDQVNDLKEHGIRAEYIDSTLCKSEANKILNDVQNGTVSILYVSPERLLTDSFLDAIKDRSIYMVVVDECHCVLEWGISFRPDYLAIPVFLKELKNRPILAAFTATATPEDRKEIQSLLGMKKPKEFITSIDRSNLILMKEEVPSCFNKKGKYDDDRTFDNKLSYLDFYMKKYHFDKPSETNGSMVVYCSTRTNTEATYNYLCSIYPGRVSRCHAGMKQKTRAKQERQFLDGKKNIMVATSAFGMGINKKDINLIIHLDMPFSIGIYYQEAGRAGREGQTAHCVLLYNEHDIEIGYALAEKQKTDVRDFMRNRLYEMEAFVHSGNCMMQDILSYFGEKKEKSCKHCSNCQRKRRYQK